MVPSGSDVPVRPARETELPKDAGDLLHAYAPDPEGVFSAGPEGAAPLGLAAAAVRGDVLQVVHLEVVRAARGKGVGPALWTAVRAYGAARGARTAEFARPADEGTLGFLLGAGLPVRGVALRLRAAAGKLAEQAPVPLTPLPPGAPLTGWIADLDRETRGFPRAADWGYWTRRGSELLSTRRRGRPEGLGALTRAGRRALLGPVAAARPETAAELLLALAGEGLRRGAEEIEAVVPSEARLLVAGALRAGFRVAGFFPVLGGRLRGDLRRYAASPTAFF
ncbi:MAG TPA: hypothetical protein PK598_14450 [Thermoanaerobaculia bacterium]|nr:hypothetical protein [Thermoanaerobaculia bacterium]